MSRSADETFALGKRFAALLSAGDIVALHGGLGAGKTVFAKGIAAGLGVGDTVTSPTFAILKEYDASVPLSHFDLYRIEDDEELLHIGFYDHIDGGSVSVIEWAEHAAHLPPCIHVRFTGSGTDIRTITIEGRELP